MNVTEADLRFAELVARTGLESPAGGRTDIQLEAALAQFAPGGGQGIRVESLTRDVTEAEWCTCMSVLAAARVGA
jgi:hypothetical protein